MDTAITYIHDRPASLLSQFIQIVLPLTGMKRVIERSMAKRNFSQKPGFIPKSLKTEFELNVTEKNGRRIWTFIPGNNRSEKTILYLHGGAYIFNMTYLHWNLIEDLLKKTNATLVVPDYPLAPDANFRHAYDFLTGIYNILLETSSPNNIVVMGDSSGGGLALGFVQRLRNENKAQPSQIILLSPWLDITMSNPDLPGIDSKDKVLGIKGLQLAGQAYADDVDPKDYRVSPIYGDPVGLGKISLFTGTHYLLLADARKFKSLMDKANISFNYYEYPGMFHDWVIVTSMKESQHATDQIAGLVNHQL